MGISQKIIAYNDDSDARVTLYGVDKITDIEEGNLFGVIVSNFNTTIIFPCVVFRDGNLAYSFECAYQYETGFGIDSNVYYDGKELPLIFKKLNGNLAQELLSGEIFVLNGGTQKDESLFSVLSADEFQNAQSKYLDNNVVIACEAEEYSTEKNILNAFFKVDDQFKALYSRDTLPNKDAVINAMKSLKEHAKNFYYNKYKECICKLHNVAETDNVIYDAIHANNDDMPKKM